MIVDANGGKVFCEVTGDGPALLIPGHASTPRFWRRAALFSDEFTVIGCDVRGEAMQTEFPPGPYTLDDLADDCADVLTEVGVERAHVIGLSHTGMVAQALALRHPSRVDRLVLTNTTPGLERQAGSVHDLPVPEGEYTDAMVAAESGSLEGVRRVSALAYSKEALERDPSLVDEAVEYGFGPIFARSPEERAQTWAAYGSFNVRDRLGEIQSPTLVVTTGSDRMVAPEDAWAIWNGIPKSTLVAFDGVGHDWYVEAPELIGRVVRMFLKGELETG